MAKIIYFYMNDDDLTQFLYFLTDNGLHYHTKDNIRAIDTMPNWIKITCEEKAENDSRFIKLSTCGGQDTDITEAYFLLSDEAEADEVLKKAFRMIKRYIQTNYTLSPTKAYYYAPGIYGDWLENRILLPVLLEREEYSVDINEFDLERFINEIAEKGYIVRTNLAKLRVMDEIDINADSMVIYTPSSKINTTIIKRSFIRYENNSECIYLYRTRKKKRQVYQFLLDKRITEERAPELIELFKSLPCYEA